MALWGKGDPRWIVEERPDSKNVNNWHWTERDATIWSKEKLRKMFLSVKEKNDQGSWKIDEVKTITGESTINNRKGKLIFFYEWELKFGYKGQIKGSEVDHKGTISIPNLSDENTPDEIDVEIIAKGDSKNAEALKQLIRKNGIEMCREKCGEYISALRAEYTQGMVLPTKEKNSTNINGASKDVAKQFKVNEQMQNLDVNKDKKLVEVSISLTEEFKTRAVDIYHTLTQSERLSAFTRSSCSSDPKVDGEFSLMNGNITGKYIEVEVGKKIVQKWKFKEWKEGVYSTVTIELEEKPENTLLKLKQTGVPDFDKSRTEQGWNQHFFGPIKQLFGYGASLF